MDNTSRCLFCQSVPADNAANSPSGQHVAWDYFVIVISVLLVSGIIGIILRRKCPSAKVDGINSLCAGMFLGMALIHLIPHAASVCSTWPYFVAAGYLCVLFVEKVLVPRLWREKYYELPHQPDISARQIGETANSRTSRLSQISVRDRSNSAVGDLFAKMEGNNLEERRVEDLAIEVDLAEDRVPASIALVAALSFHSIFEGLAIGTQDISNMWVLTAAVGAHKWAAAFAITSFIARDDAPLDRSHFRLLAIFILASPAGALLGLVMRVSDALLGPVTAMAGGTLLYVAMSEVIPSEFSKSDGSHIGKLFSLMLGLAGIAFLSTLSHQEDNEGWQRAVKSVCHNCN